MVEETTDVNKQIEFFLNSFSLDNKRDKEKAVIIINYITRQLNNESLKGNIDYYQYRSLVLDSVKGLFKLIYIEFLDFDEKPKRMENIIKSDIVFASSNNLLQLLFTRVYKGADRELILEQIRSQRPILMSQNTR